MDFEYGSVQPYQPPEWARSLKIRPATRVMLCMRPTPIHQWKLPDVPNDFQVSIKRDDLTGSTLSGNKVRKLEFLLADALSQGCDVILTVGGLKSNHARATAIAARELGMSTHLLLRGSEEEDSTNLCFRGNLLLDRLSAERIIVASPPPGLKIEEHIKILHQQTLQYKEKLRSEGRKPYFIPGGGSTPIGEWGYIEAFREMMEQGVLEKFDDVVITGGSAGTACGLSIANYLTGSKVKIHAVSIDHSLPYLYKEIEHHLVEFGLDSVAPSDLMDIIDGYMGGGYGTSSQEELAKIVEVFGRTGISLDPDFTVKTLRGMLGEMEGNPGRFAGKRVLFLHTGGIYSLFDGRIDPILRDSTNFVYSIDDVLS